MYHFTPIMFASMQGHFLSGITNTYDYRKHQLLTLRKAVEKYESLITEALYNDLHKSAEEAFTTEIGFIYSEISYTIKNLKNWMKPVSVKTPVFLQPSSSKIKREALGVCLIIAPWNYPFQLLIAPLIGAIAGGNCAVLKPSEMTMNTSGVIRRMIADFFKPEYITVVEGDGAIVVPKIMNENRFDYVFFTGSIPVGRQIAIMAAEKLVPVTLELGGKSPCIIDEDADLEVASKRIVWGKFTNAGQTCVAPDYLLVHKKNKQQLIELLKKHIKAFYGEKPERSADYGRIVNVKRLTTLESFLNDGKILAGGQVIKEELYMAPTLLDSVSIDSAVMKEEIFGPVLPILTYSETLEALEIIKLNPNPLSLYYFGNNKEHEKLFIEQIPFGGGCINNTLVHLANADLPFGGVGSSGVGTYHGKFSFDTFTRTKAILKSATWFDPLVKYPPYTGKLKYLKWFFK